PYGPVLSATVLGQFFNNVLPARAGEVARVIALHQSAGTSRAEAIVTVVVERLYDVLALLVMLFVLLPWLPRVAWVHTAALVAIGLSMILPSSPAAVGVFEAATLVALHVYGIPKSQGLSYALVLHAANFFPYIIAGLVVLRTHTLDLRQKASTIAEAREAPH